MKHIYLLSLFLVVVPVAAFANTLMPECSKAKESGREIWATCAPLLRESKELTVLLSNPVVISEINSYPDRLTSFTEDYEKKLEQTKFGVIAELLKVDSRFDMRILGYRFAVELYKTMDGEKAECEFEGGYEVCLGSKHMARVLMDPKIPRLERDLSEMKVNRHVAEYFRIISRSGYLENSDAPATQEFATFPPPAIPGWSEQYEPHRDKADQAPSGIKLESPQSATATTNPALTPPGVQDFPKEPITPIQPHASSQRASSGAFGKVLVGVGLIIGILIFVFITRRRK